MEPKNRRELLYVEYARRLRAQYPQETIEWIALRAEQMVDKEVAKNSVVGGSGPSTANSGSRNAESKPRSPPKRPAKQKSGVPSGRSVAKNGERRSSSGAGRSKGGPPSEELCEVQPPTTKPADLYVYVQQIFGGFFAFGGLAVLVMGTSGVRIPPTNRFELAGFCGASAVPLLGGFICWGGFRRQAKRQKIRAEEEARWKQVAHDRGTELARIMDEIRIKNSDKTSSWVRKKAEQQQRTRRSG